MFLVANLKSFDKRAFVSLTTDNTQNVTISSKFFLQTQKYSHNLIVMKYLRHN